MKNKYKIIEVTITEKYLIPMRDENRTDINNQLLEDVIHDWFDDSNLDVFHATRDTHRIGNSREMKNWKVE